MTVIKRINTWKDIPTDAVLIDAETEREIRWEYVEPYATFVKPYVQLYDHNGFKLMSVYTKYIPKGIKVKMQVEI